MDLTVGELANKDFSNAEGGGMTAADYEALSKQTAAALQAAKEARDAREAATGCHKKVWPSKKNKEEYAACLAANKTVSAPTPSYTPTPTPEAKPFYKTGTGITVIVVGSLALLVGGFLLIRKFKK